jgi:ribosomal protein L6P/L9E
MVGSQIAHICRTATLAAITEIIQGPKEAHSRKLSLRAAHFRQSMEELQKKDPSAC